MESNGGLMHLRVAEEEKSDCLRLLQRRRDVKTKTVEDNERDGFRSFQIKPLCQRI